METLQEHPSLHHRSGRKLLLIVQDDAEICQFLQEAIQQETPYLAFTTTNYQEAIAISQQMKPDLLLLGYLLPPTTGIALYDQLHCLDGLDKVPAIIASSSLEKHREEIEQRHLIGINKPFDLDELLHTIALMLA